jgi:hypothetical protein
MYQLPAPPEFRTPPQVPTGVCCAEAIMRCTREAIVPVGLRLNGVDVPRIISFSREWLPGEMPRLVITVEPTYFTEIDEGEPPAFPQHTEEQPVAAG